MSKLTLVIPIAIAAAPPACAEGPSRIDEVIKRLEARFEPAEARPGQKVTLKIELKLAEGWYTYPTAQPDREAVFNVNKITFPKDGAIHFSGRVTDPPKPRVEEFPQLEIKELRTYPGGGTWECEAQVRHDAKQGLAKAKITFRVIVGRGGPDPRWFVPKKFDLEATIKVAGEPVPGPKLPPIPPPPAKKPAVLKSSITDKGGIVWQLDFDRALKQARDQEKLVLIDFAAISNTNWVYNEQNVLPRMEVAARIKEYVCLRLFIDAFPDDHFDGDVGPNDGEKAAEKNYSLMGKTFGGGWSPFFVIVRPTKDGGFEKIVTAGGKEHTRDVPKFVEFLSKPLRPAKD